MSMRRKSSEKNNKSQLRLQVSVDLDLSRLEVEKHPVIAVLGGAVPTYGFVFFFSSKRISILLQYCHVFLTNIALIECARLVFCNQSQTLRVILFSTKRVNICELCCRAGSVLQI